MQYFNKKEKNWFDDDEEIDPEASFCSKNSYKLEFFVSYTINNEIEKYRKYNCLSGKYNQLFLWTVFTHKRK